MTTNNTSLQPGYIVFVSYVVFSLILSQVLHSVVKREKEHGYNSSSPEKNAEPEQNK